MCKHLTHNALRLSEQLGVQCFSHCDKTSQLGDSVHLSLSDQVLIQSVPVCPSGPPGEKGDRGQSGIGQKGPRGPAGTSNSSALMTHRGSGG